MKEVVLNLAVSVNANTKNSKVKHRQMSKIYCDSKTQLVQFTDLKKHLKNDQKLKLIFIKS